MGLSWSEVPWVNSSHHLIESKCDQGYTYPGQGLENTSSWITPPLPILSDIQIPILSTLDPYLIEGADSSIAESGLGRTAEKLEHCGEIDAMCQAALTAQQLGKLR